MKKLLLIAACISVSTANAQKRDTAKMYDFGKKIFIEPLPLIDGYNAPSLRLGIEWPILKNFCSIFVVGGQYLNTGLFQSQPYSGQYTKIGFRLYPSTCFTARSSETFYLSLHGFYKSQKFSTDDNISEAGPRPGKEVKYDVSKDSKGIHVEVGMLQARRHLCFEAYLGIGIRQSTVVNSAGDSLLAVLYHFHEGFVTNIGNSNKANAILPSMTLGVRLSYLFKTKLNASSSSKTYGPIHRKLQML